MLNLSHVFLQNSDQGSELRQLYHVCVVVIKLMSPRLLNIKLNSFKQNQLFKESCVVSIAAFLIMKC
jgi:hypothetical protein